MHPDGRKAVGLDTGIKWFLNLCASYDEHLKKEEDHSMSWIKLFGSEVEGNFLDTRAFPALFLDDKKAILPKQHNGYNCGIGICTTIGILMRDFLKEDESYNIDNLFCKQVMPMLKDTVNSEMFCQMPKKSKGRFSTVDS